MQRKIILTIIAVAFILLYLAWVVKSAPKEDGPVFELEINSFGDDRRDTINDYRAPDYPRVYSESVQDHDNLGHLNHRRPRSIMVTSGTGGFFSRQHEDDEYFYNGDMSTGTTTGYR